jgi:hypothetical protein
MKWMMSAPVAFTHNSLRRHAEISKGARASVLKLLSFNSGASMPRRNATHSSTELDAALVDCPECGSSNVALKNNPEADPSMKKTGWTVLQGDGLKGMKFNCRTYGSLVSSLRLPRRFPGSPLSVLCLHTPAPSLTNL